MHSLRLYWLLKNRRRTQQRIRNNPSNRLQREGAVIAAFLLLISMLGIIAVGVLFFRLTRDLPPVSRLQSLLDPQQGSLLFPTQLFDNSGNRLIYTIENPREKRRFLRVGAKENDRFSDPLIQVAVAHQQPNFWQDSGFTFHLLNESQPLTIPEKVALNLLIPEEPAGMNRTLRVRFLAAQMISQYGHDKVLEWYLNSLYFGHLCYGAESAAQGYLGKSASDLNLAEAALLMAISETPALNPWDAPQAAQEQQRKLLENLFINGQIDTQEYLNAKKAIITFLPKPEDVVPFAPAFIEQVLQESMTQWGRQTIERGGLEITTTLDWDLQNQIRCVAPALLNGNTPNASEASSCQALQMLPFSTEKTDLTGSIEISTVVTDPRSGEVLGLLGRFDGTTEKAMINGLRPGTTLTPFVALSAFSRGYAPGSLVWDIPASLPEKHKKAFPINYTYHGPMRLRNALVKDYVIPFLKITDQIGSKQIWQTIAPLGFNDLARTADMDSLLLGGGETSLNTLAHAYGLFATLGKAPLTAEKKPSYEPSFIRKIAFLGSNTNVTYQSPENTTVLSPSLAYLVIDTLRGTPRQNAAEDALFDVGRPVAIKASTSNENGQSWMIGFTPQRMVITWMGASNPAATIIPDAAHLIPQRFWNVIMRQTSQDLESLDWDSPSDIKTVQVCDPSGLLPTSECPAKVDEIFLNGFEPTTKDTFYREFIINRESGYLATVFTPPELIEKHVYPVYPPEALEWAKKAGIVLPSQIYDMIQAPGNSASISIDQPGLFDYIHGKINILGSAAEQGLKSYTLQVGQGINPQQWIQLGSDSVTPVKNGILGTWDTTGLEGLYALRLTVLFEDSRVQSTIIQVTVDNTPPSCQIISPASEAHYQISQTGNLLLQAKVNDVFGIKSSEWFVDDKSIGQVFSAPYQIVWPVTPGEHTMKVNANDLAGNVCQSESVSISAE